MIRQPFKARTSEELIALLSAVATAIEWLIVRPSQPDFDCAPAIGSGYARNATLKQAPRPAGLACAVMWPLSCFARAVTTFIPSPAA